MQHVHVENITNQQVGARIAEVRSAMKITQADLASEMSVRLGREIRPLTVTRLEGGKRPIGVDELVAAAEVLRIKPADLLIDGSLNVGSVRIVGAYQRVVRASNQLEMDVRQWFTAQKDLIDILDGEDGEYLDRLPTMTRNEVDSVRNWTVQEIVDGATNGEGSDDDSEA
jgi:transcriptional regulator with XRE-family HTH domain